MHTVDEAITLLNPTNGWLQNCNSTPFTAAANFSPKKEDYPNYMSIDRENFRGVHAIDLLKNVSGLTLDGLITLAYDPYLPAFAELIPGLVKAYDDNKKGNKEIKEPIALLRQWDFKTSENSVAMSLAHFYATLYNRKGKLPKRMTAMERTIYFGTQSPEKERLAIFTEVVQQLTTDFGTWQTPWGEINRYQRLDGKIRQDFNDDLPSLSVGIASGRWGALAAFGARYTNNTKRIYGTRGNSFVAVVEFGEKVKAKSLLAGGNNGNPNSKHFKSQAIPYTKGQFKDVLFYKEDVKKHAESTYQPGNK